MSSRFDVIVVGGGPAGSIAALVLARGGARVALVDKAQFPRDKACGDIVGPRALQLLTDLGLPAPKGRNVGEIVVVGPTGRRVQLPCGEGLTYPGHGTAVTRTVFDSMLHEEALEAGAIPVYGLAVEPLELRGANRRFPIDRRDRVARRLRDRGGRRDEPGGGGGRPGRRQEGPVGFRVRTYIPQAVDLPAIVFWESAPFQGFPGYGWVFPGPTGGANVGLGLGTVADRKAGAKVQQALPRFLEHLREIELLGDASSSMPTRRLGGWLKMGMIGTVPAAGRVLLVGDAAGLVNPLQGEGIAQAMCSGRCAAEALLARARPSSRALSADARRRPPSVSPDHRRSARVARRPATGGGSGVSADHDGRPKRCSGGWLVGLLERVARRRSSRSSPFGGRNGQSARRMMTAQTATARWFDTTFPDLRTSLICQEVDLSSTGSDSVGFSWAPEIPDGDGDPPRAESEIPSQRN